MVKLTKDTEERDRRHMGKEWGTGDKECGSLLDKDAKRVNLNWNR